MRVDVGNGASKPKRIPLEAETLDQARAELEEVRTANRKGTLHAPGRRPLFAALVAEYLASAEFSGKRPNTRRRERQSLARWVAVFGDIRCDWITVAHLSSWRDRRKAEGVKPETVNLDLISLGNALRYASDRGWISDVPKLKRLKPQPRASRELLTPAAIARLLEHCRPDIVRNATLMNYYIRFLALTGARKKEALRVRWADIDFDREQVTIGADGHSKGGRARAVNFNAELAALVREMHAGRQPDSAFCSRVLAAVRGTFRRLHSPTPSWSCGVPSACPA